MRGSVVNLPVSGTGIYIGPCTVDSDQSLVLINVNGIPLIVTGRVTVPECQTIDDIETVAGFDENILSTALQVDIPEVSVTGTCEEFISHYGNHPPILAKAVLYRIALNLPAVQHNWRPNHDL